MKRHSRSAWGSGFRAAALREWLANGLATKDVVGGIPEDGVAGGRLSHNCYVEHAVPACLYFAFNAFSASDRQGKTCGQAFSAALLANANAGGDCTNRGALLGLLCGAACGFDAIPRDLLEGLADKETLLDEIDAFVALCQ